MIRPAAAENWLVELTSQVPNVRRLQSYGRVVELVGLTVVADGPAAAVGEICMLEPAIGAPEIPAQVVGFRGHQVLLLPLRRLAGVEPGCRVRATGEALQVMVGPQVLGRVLNAFGEPLDGRGPIIGGQRRPVEGVPPPALSRQPVCKPLYFGIRALDGLLTCGRGQRLGVFSGAGVGKSSLLGMMARGCQVDVIVVALVGERGREVREFIERHLRGDLDRAVLVVATSDEPALMRLTAGLTATAIAEYFRDQGQDVLFLMDSLTRLARAQREAGLAIGEAPTTRGYPPSMYEFLPRLLERAGPGEVGTITGIYSVLVEGDDLQEPVADTVSAIVDGHVVLQRELADQGHYPAIDIVSSISRLMNAVVDGEQRQAAARVRSFLAARREADDLLAVGAYRAGSRPLVDQALQRWDMLMTFLRQRECEQTPPSDTRRRLLELAGL